MTFQITSLNIFSSETSFILIIFFIIIFIFSAYTSYKKKNNKKNNEEKEVKKKIKLYLKEKSQIKHKIIEFEKVISKSYKKSRRNIYEVFINLYDAKTKELFTKKCCEIEGFSESLDKKNFFSI
jgi:predicted negative regulator of RcsB-dependent stress response